MIRRIKIVVLCGVAISIIILLFMGVRLFISYGLGFILGCVNLAVMAMFFNIILSLRSVRVVLFQILSYLMRYAAIALGVIKAASGGILGVVLFVLGLLTVNFSYVASSYSKENIFQGK